MIPKKLFGRTGHESSRTIFGAFALSTISQKEANHTLELLLEYGINHIDTAASYGESELRIGPWMKKYRNKFFLATKTEKRTYKDAKEELHRSLDRLKVDSIDLWQMHMLVNPEEWQIALHSGGAIEAFIEAKEQGLVKHIGVTGHGLAAPGMHLRSLQIYDFDAVLLPYNYSLMQNESYASDFSNLLKKCNDDNIAVQTIKSIAKGLRNASSKPSNVWYDALENKDAIHKNVSWVLSNNDVFLNTVGDANLLKIVLESAANLKSIPSDKDMKTTILENGITPLFTGNEI